MATSAPNRQTIAAMIDHALLRPECTPSDLRAACELVTRLGVGCLCVRGSDVAEAGRLLAGRVKLAAVVGFPHGCCTTQAKVAEAHEVIADGADELDMVLNIGRLRGGQVEYVRDDIAAVVAAAANRPVKVILECAYLRREEMSAGCRAAVEAGAAFVKTSTGFGPHGARTDDVRHLRSQVGPDIGVKAAGGIRTLADALVMIRAGADRIGTSSSEAILDELERL